MNVRKGLALCAAVVVFWGFGGSGYAADRNTARHEMHFAHRIGHWFGVKLREKSVTQDEVIEHLNHVRPIHSAERAAFHSGFVAGFGGRGKRAERLWVEIWVKSQPRAKVFLAGNGTAASYEYKDGYWYGRRLANGKVSRREVVRHLNHVAPLTDVQERHFSDGFAAGYGAGGHTRIARILRDVRPDRVGNPVKPYRKIVLSRQG